MIVAMIHNLILLRAFLGILLMRSCANGIGEGLRRVVRAQPTSELIELFKSENFLGDSVQLAVPYGNHCINLNPEWNNKALSVNPANNKACVILFEGSSCTGKGVRFQKFTFGAMDLNKVGLRRTATSLRLC